MSAAGDRLSRCASALLALVETRDEACAQFAALGFAEEHLRLFRGNYGRAALGVLADHGYTGPSFEEALTERTCSRFVGVGLGAVLLGALPPDARPLKTYRITVGFADEDGERHVLGTVEVRARSWSQARGLAIDAVFDERLRCSGCSPWTGVEHRPRNG